MKKIRDIMNTEVERTHPTATVKQAADRMRALDVGTLPVCEGKRIIGVLTDREMTVHIAAVGRDSGTTLVKDNLNPDPALVSDDDSIKSAERTMETKGTHRVFVVDRDRNLVGIVSLGKVSRVDNPKAAGQIVGSISRSRKSVG